MWGNNFGAGPCPPYARTGADVRISYMAAPAEIDQKSLDYAIDHPYLEETMRTMAEGNCVITFDWDSGHWSHSWGIEGSLGHWILEEPEWCSDYQPEGAGANNS